MRINPIDSNSVYTRETAIVQIQNNLISIARTQQMTVDELVESAKNAENPNSLQTRVLNMVERLDKLR